MMIDMTVNSVDDITFDAGFDGHGTCHGDSGGPALQNGVVVGTVSYGDTPDCHDTNHFARVDDNLDFITSYLSF
jgi:secreted trypsin-like serine protease